MQVLVFFFFQLTYICRAIPAQISHETKSDPPQTSKFAPTLQGFIVSACGILHSKPSS